MSIKEEINQECPLKDEINILDVNLDFKTSNQVRTRKELSLKEKLDILKQYDKLPKMSQRSAAFQLNISQPVLCKILKNRSFIENIMLTNKNSVRKRTRGGKEREIESALKLWYVEVKKKNIPINGQIIRKKAKELGRQMGKEFAATDGWFTRWRKRENIVYNSIFKRKTSESADPLDCQTPEESTRWELENKKLCEVYIKTEFEFEKEKPTVSPPTDEEMLEALRVLSTGVKHRTNDLQLQYEYETFIYQLLKKVV